VRPRTAESFAEVFERLGVQTRGAGVWAQHGVVDREHGWKLHLSSTQRQAASLVERVAPFLKEHRVPFKVAADSTILGLLNEGLLGETQVGKFITVYVDCLSDSSASDLTNALISATATFHGPAIRTDAYLGGVVYCRYGDYASERRRNRLGLFELSPEIRLLTDYQVPFAIPKGIVGAERFQISSQLEPDPLGLAGNGFLPVGLLRSHAKGRVYLAVDVRDQDTVKKVVIKEGRAGCMSDAFGRDVRDRLLHHAAVEQALLEKVLTPRVEACFSKDNNVYLALEYVEGVDFSATPAAPFRLRSAEEKRSLLRHLSAAALQIAALHDCGFVHRDLSPTNLRVSQRGCVWLMDLELAYDLNEEGPPYPQGTVGYVSPQQKENQRPRKGDDVFSFGALLANQLTGFPGHHIPIGAPDLAERLGRLSGAPVNLVALIAQCLEIDTDMRPSITEVVDCLGSTSEAAAGEVDEPMDQPFPDRRPPVESGLKWLVHGASVDGQSKMWLSPALEQVHTQTTASVMDWRVYRSANRGVAGIVYALAKLSRYGFNLPGAEERLSHSVDWLLGHQDSPDDQLPGLHFGEAGVCVAISEAIAAGMIDEEEWTDPYLDEVFRAAPDWPDLTHGAAGQGLAALIVGNLLDRLWVTECSDRYAEFLHKTQDVDGGWTLPAGVDAMSGKSYTGCAHGAAGIVYFLAHHARARDCERSLESAQLGAEWLLNQAKPTSNLTGLSWPMDSTVTESWNWWCHGSPGIAMAFLALYQVTREAIYANTARACVRTIPRHFRAMNLSQCHGLAGLGEVLLEAHEVLGDADLLIRSREISTTLADLAWPEEVGVAWKVENLHVKEADLMTGTAGVLHFLARSTSEDHSFGSPLMLPSNFGYKEEQR
jgi:hypothetical protein